tara:strand:- start:5156 stop:6739 length:1584 start_codon:yes stop_codon:yes gene_type:complete
MACTCKPGKALCRSCLDKDLVPYVGPTTDGAGNYTVHQIDLFQKQFEGTIVDDTNSNPLSEAVNKHGRTSFYNAVEQLNTDFLKRPSIIAMLPDYEVLHYRVQRGPITAVEFASFIKDSNYTPSGAIASYNATGSRFLFEMEGFYNGDFSTSVMGGFCSLFSDIFGVIGAFFDLIGTIEGIYADALEMIAKIKNIENELIAAFEKIKVKALLEAIKKKISEAIKKAIEKVKKAIENFSIENILGEIDNFVQKNIVAKVQKIKQDIEKFFSKENMKKIEEKIKKLIDYTVSQFENPSIEEIQFMIMRFCALATGIEGLIKGLKDPLSDFSNRYDEVFNTLANASNRITGEAIRGGALRGSDYYRKEQINKARIAWEKMGNTRPPSTKEYGELPKWEDLEAGSDSRLKVKGDWVTDMKPPHEGWDEIDIDVRVLLMRLYEDAKAEGLVTGPITLLSGYRNPSWNKTIRGSRSSQHMNGYACDIQWDGFKKGREELAPFVKLARANGFKGFGYYDTFLHIDIGRSRSWNG